ncbi:hypothetical protein BV20DRAFT_1122171 [Pilatotrama ljubarskyi]|nr:hypothetical protein BV20DRAFT_1122171 [Pilatotrama ljubarskyi]
MAPAGILVGDHSRDADGGRCRSCGTRHSEAWQDGGEVTPHVLYSFHPTVGGNIFSKPRASWAPGAVTSARASRVLMHTPCKQRTLLVWVDMHLLDVRRSAAARISCLRRGGDPQWRQDVRLPPRRPSPRPPCIDVRLTVPVDCQQIWSAARKLAAYAPPPRGHLRMDRAAGRRSASCSTLRVVHLGVAFIVKFDRRSEHSASACLGSLAVVRTGNAGALPIPSCYALSDSCLAWFSVLSENGVDLSRSRVAVDPEVAARRHRVAPAARL